MNSTHRIQNLVLLPFEEPSDLSVLEKICTWLLVLCPILQHYKSVYDNAATVAMICAFFCFGVKLLRLKQWRLGFVLPLILMSIYEICNHGTGISEIAREALLTAYFIAAASGAIDLKYFRKIAACIALVAGALLVVQYICYYILGFHLQLAAVSLLDSSAEQWVQLVQTGRISVTGKEMRFYRPSAFFLEPSHIALYCFPSLAAVILDEKFDRRHIAAAVLLSLGILLSTSGMGIGMVFGLWGVWLLRKLMGKGSIREQLKRVLQPKSLIWLGGAAAFVLLLYIGIEPFRMSVNRIFYNPDGSNAITGRMGTGITAIRGMSGLEIWFGKSKWGNVHNWNMAGFFYTFYTQGCFGMLLSYGFYLNSLRITRNAWFWTALLLIGLSFVTVHTHAAFYMLYYVLLLLSGYPLEQDKLTVKNVFFPLWSRVEDQIQNLWKKGKAA